ncbi:MAG: hypothetical protein H6Q12_28 [Bacteroidetes bacterium]|nr:hypothetical protein [Bacteroidota bacterium]
MSERQPKNDSRNKPSIDPNPHYYCDMFFQNIKTIIAAIVLILLIVLMVACDLKDGTQEIFKALAFIVGGFLFGSNIK